MSKEEMLFDDDFYSEKPELSEYEFELMSIKKDVESFSEKIVDPNGYGTK